MATSLIIVESPAKTKTLKNFLSGSVETGEGKSGFVIEASMGHVRDLPEREMGIDVNDDFKPKYVSIPTRRDVLKRLTEAARKADVVYLASDPDREGEAIAWHLAQALKLKNARRIEFNEITRSAVLNAIHHPRDIDAQRVNAQEARRLLDRLVGYRLSPLLWKKVRKNLSAGRVQSVAVRLICDREREILAFVPVEYWSLTATLTPRDPDARFPFEARFVGRGKEKVELHREEEAAEIVRAVEGAAWAVRGVRRQERKRNPAAPFITSTLQQEASRKLGFGNRRTMSTAQQLYEGVELGGEGSVGLITYMRTDSTRVAAEAQAEARAFLGETYGANYLPAQPPQYRARSAAQDAHEAIRPTSAFRTPESVAEFLSNEQVRLYRLIWQRFIASQMPPAIFDVTTADIDAAGHTFRSTGSVMKFDGFMRVYLEGRDGQEQDDEDRAPLPSLTGGQALDLLKLEPRQHFTEPPPRYTEATLVKALEEKGIGRPSTYATIISTVQDRGYVALEDKRFGPTELGLTVNDLLVKHFPDILDVGFTAGMETRLDEVEEGRADKVRVLRDFYEPFERSLSSAHETMERIKPEAVETEHLCPTCGKKMMLRQSARGPFLGCSGYPRCRTILNVGPDGEPLPVEEKAPALTDQPCPKCGKPLVEREGRFGKFLGCSAYPKCKTIVKLPGDQGPQSAPTAQPTGIQCPRDGGEIVAKRSRRGAVFYGCANYPQCDFTTWHRPIGRPCPECGWPLGEQSFRGRTNGTLKCSNPDCSYSEKTAPAPEPVSTG
ncbi:MAG: type I DNA topoisomerase [Chthonomonadales bacterium]|nr:type I DNA topoisomerase [Chthonomonadales bacterium]